MLDGKYGASLNTPIGAMKGTLTLQSQGNEVNGILDIMGMKNQFQGTKTKENECSFYGKFNTPIGNIEYRATCVVNGDQMELMTNTNKGNFHIQGKRM